MYASFPPTASQLAPSCWRSCRLPPHLPPARLPPPHVICMHNVHVMPWCSASLQPRKCRPALYCSPAAQLFCRDCTVHAHAVPRTAPAPAQPNRLVCSPQCRCPIVPSATRAVYTLRCTSHHIISTLTIQSAPTACAPFVPLPRSSFCHEGIVHKCPSDLICKGGPIPCVLEVSSSWGLLNHVCTLQPCALPAFGWLAPCLDWALASGDPSFAGARCHTSANPCPSPTPCSAITLLPSAPQSILCCSTTTRAPPQTTPAWTGTTSAWAAGATPAPRATGEPRALVWWEALPFFFIGCQASWRYTCPEGYR